MNIIRFLKSQFPEADISFDGEDCNSKVLIISKEFEGLTTLKRHKLVLRALKDHFKTGELHALSLTTKAPSEMS
jgi:acid stress-induced BolA-like protein IbaG/YrbA